MIPPYPSLASVLSSSTSTSRPAASPKAFARLANSAGKRWLGGVLTKSRAVATAVAIAAARAAMSFVAARVSGVSTLILRTPASRGAVLSLRKAVNR